MKTKVGRMLGVAWLGVGCLGLLLSPLSAREAKLQYTLMGQTGQVRSVVISPDGKRIVSGSQDKTVKVWEVAMAKQADK